MLARSGRGVALLPSRIVVLIGHLADHMTPNLDIYRQAFNASPDYISFSRLSDGACIDINPNFEKITGLRRVIETQRSCTREEQQGKPRRRTGLRHFAN
jgi:PAS domain-containing protein